jgi:hypothetical protein
VMGSATALRQDQERSAEHEPRAATDRSAIRRHACGSSGSPAAHHTLPGSPAFGCAPAPPPARRRCAGRPLRHGTPYRRFVGSARQAERTFSLGLPSSLRALLLLAARPLPPTAAPWSCLYMCVAGLLGGTIARVAGNPGGVGVAGARLGRGTHLARMLESSPSNSATRPLSQPRRCSRLAFSA